MYRKSARLFSLIMAAAIGVSLFSGCGNDKKTTQKETTSSATGDTKQEKPLKFSILSWAGTSDYVTQSPDITKDKYLLALNKKFNIEMTMKMIDDKNRDQQTQMLMASGEIPDVVLGLGDVNYVGLAGSVHAGMYWDLTDILKKNMDKWRYLNQIPQNAWEYGQVNGKQYGIPVQYLGVTSRRATFIRKDLLDKTGLKVPKTLDEYLEVLRAFKKLGVKYPYAGRTRWEFTDLFFSAFGVQQYDQWNLDKEGRMVPDIIRPEMKEALKFHAQLYKEGLMDPESLTTNSTDWGNKINAGKVGLFTSGIGELSGRNTNLKQNVPEGELIAIPSPEGPRGNKGMYRYPPVNVMAYINKNFKEPERLLKLLDDQLSPEGCEFFAFGIEGDTYTKKDGRIQYKYPTDKAGMNEQGWRTNSIGIARDDAAYNKLMLPFQPKGNEILDWFEKVGPKEGYIYYQPKVQLKSIESHPDLAPKNNSLFLDYSAKIFLGQGDADKLFDDFVKEYLRRGGEDVIKEATEMYKTGKFYNLK